MLGYLNFIRSHNRRIKCACQISIYITYMCMLCDWLCPPLPTPPNIQGNEVEDGDVCTVRYVNEAMSEQQLETKIYQMSREEAKT